VAAVRGGAGELGRERAGKAPTSWTWRPTSAHPELLRLHADLES
jgi:hypothetical protein